MQRINKNSKEVRNYDNQGIAVNYGFTLIELLIAALIIGVLSIISIQLLFDTVTVKSKEYALTSSSDEAFRLMENFASSLKAAKSIDVKAGGKQVDFTTSDSCVSYRYNTANKSIELAEDSIASCNPSIYIQITSSGFTIDDFSLSPEGALPENINIAVEGEIKDPLSSHPFKYETNVFPRISL